MAKKPAKKSVKKKPSKYEEKFIIKGTFDEMLKALGKQIKNKDN